LYLAPASGNLVQQAAPSSTSAQAWKFTEVETGYYKIENAANPGLVLGLEIEDCSTIGDRIKLVSWANNDYQKWQVIRISPDNYTFVNKALCKNRAILVPGYSTTAGTLISTYELLDPSDAQQVFTLTTSSFCSGGARIRTEESNLEIAPKKEIAAKANELAIDDLKLEGNKFILYPNPASDQIEVKYYLPSASIVSFTLFSVNGNVVDKHNVQGKAGYNTFILKLDKHESGTYILKGVFGFKQDSKKFIIER
jgi:hypothetical protein